MNSDFLTRFWDTKQNFNFPNLIDDLPVLQGLALFLYDCYSNVSEAHLPEELLQKSVCCGMKFKI